MHHKDYKNTSTQKDTMKLVISLGGSLISKDFTAGKVSQYAETLQKINTQAGKLVIVIGGGKVARDYIKIMKDLGADEDSQDKIAIMITHANAKLIALTLNHKTPDTANDDIPRTEREIKESLDRYKILVCGGTIPRQSTDSVAAKIARDIKADLLINASNIDGVYDSDPTKNKSAKKYKTLSYAEFLKIISANEQSPGKYALFDKKAADIIKENKIKTVIISGANPQELLNAVKGSHSGTTIQ